MPQSTQPESAMETPSPVPENNRDKYLEVYRMLEEAVKRKQLLRPISLSFPSSTARNAFVKALHAYRTRKGAMYDLLVSCPDGKAGVLLNIEQRGSKAGRAKMTLEKQVLAYCVLGELE